METCERVKHRELNYKEAYLTMVRASERALRILIEAQRQCEELLLDQDEEKDRA